MNCKPGDLAVVVRGMNLGLVVRVVGRAPFFPPWEPAEWEWECECLASAVGRYTGEWRPAGTIGDIEDSRLRPLRDPGDDARDETLEWLPVPQKETQWT